MQIFKRDILIPELMQISVSEFMDYPPRLLVYVKQTESSSMASLSPPELQIIGLDQECTFEVPLREPKIRATLRLDMEMQELSK